MPLAVDLLLAKAQTLSLGSNELDLISNIFVTLSNNKRVLPVVVRHLEDVILDCSDEETNLVDSVDWKDLCIGIRIILHLSFQVDHMDPCLADIFNLLTFLVGLGTPLIRRSIQSIVANIIRTLMQNESEENRSLLALSLDKLSDKRYIRLFGLESRTRMGKDEYNASSFLLNSESLNGETVHSISLSEIEYFTSILADICFYGMSQEESVAMRYRWITLAAKYTKSKILSIQSTSFVILGFLVRDFDPSIFQMCIKGLTDCLADPVDSKTQLTFSLFACLNKVTSLMKPNDPMIYAFFWIGLALCQTDEEKYYECGIQMLAKLIPFIENMSDLTIFKQARIRLGWIEDGLDFERYFSLSVSILLLRGLYSVSLKKFTKDIMQALIRLELRTLSNQRDRDWYTQLMGYLIPLFPSATPQGIDELLGTKREEDDLEYLLSLFNQQSDEPKFLQVFYLIVLLRNTPFESETLLILEFLTELQKVNADLLNGFSDTLRSFLQTLLVTNKTPRVHTLSHELHRTLIPTLKQNNNQAVLRQCNMHRLVATPTHFKPVILVGSMFQSISLWSAAKAGST